MDSRIVLCQTLAVLVCMMTYTSGSEVLFTTTPDTIQTLITESLTLRCGITDVPSTGSIIGKRHTPSDVTSRQAPSDLVFVYSILITKDGKDVARVSQHVTATGFDNFTNAQVTGQITGGGVDQEFLQVSWKYPGPDQSGSYQCVITGEGQNGLSQTLTKSVDVTNNEMTLNNLVMYIKQMKVGYDLEITQLKKTNADQSASITGHTAAIADLKQKQDTHVLFTAALYHHVNVSSGNILVFEHLITSLGGGYSTSTGVFTCPVAGYYFFHVHVMGQEGKYAGFYLSHNDNDVVKLQADDDKDYSSGSNSATIMLHKGDTVKVTSRGTSYPYGYTFAYATFSGQLVALL